MKYDAYLEKDGERRVVVTRPRPTQDLIDKFYPGWTLKLYGGHFRSLQALRDDSGYTGKLG